MDIDPQSFGYGLVIGIFITLVIVVGLVMCDKSDPGGPL